MFTGIVRGLCPIVGLSGDAAGSFLRLRIELPEELRAGLQIGDSVAVDGVCLTVTEIEAGKVSYDVISSTLSRTILGDYKVGCLVNIERSLVQGAEIGGHEVSGHVDTTAIVESVERLAENLCIFFRVPTSFGRYLFPRGFVAINGVSLTISECLEGGTLFSVWLIPETVRVTNLGSLVVGDRVNIEIHRGVQVVVDTLERSVKSFLQDLIDNPHGMADRTEAIAGLAKLFLPERG